MTVLYTNVTTAEFGGCATATKAVAAAWNQPRLRTAQRQFRERLRARDNNTLDVVRKGEQLLFGEWADFFLENYSEPPIRARKIHEANKSALKTLRPVFGTIKMTEIDATQD